MYYGSPVINTIENDTPLLSGIFTIKNAISGGYFAIESVLSVLPIVDRMFINDGGSTDGTLQAFQKLQSMYPDKIEILNILDKPSKKWEVIDNVLNTLINLCNSKWFIEVQGDEIYHEKQVIKIPELLKKAKDCNAIRHARWDLLWDSEAPEYSMGTVRIVRKIPGLHSTWGGDHFLIKGVTDKPRNGFTLHNVPPEYDTNEPIIYHYSSIFPDNANEKARRMAQEVANEDSSRKNNYKNFSGGFPSSRRCASIVPALVKGLVGLSKYEVREELFDKSWLTKTTGINYEF